MILIVWSLYSGMVRALIISDLALTITDSLPSTWKSERIGSILDMEGH